MTIADFLQLPNLARLDLELLVLYVFGWTDRSDLVLHANTQLSQQTQDQLLGLYRQRCRAYPLAYLRGFREFYGHRFLSDPRALVPRSETEALVEFAEQYLPNASSILEVGTGSGCISISLKLARPDLNIVATDLDPQALTLARSNAKLHQVNLQFLQSDLFTQVSGCFSAILANLPYVDPNWSWLSPELQFEPAQALYAKQHGLELIARLIIQAPDFLESHGWLILELDSHQLAAVTSLLEKQHFRIQQFSDFGLAGQL